MTRRAILAAAVAVAAAAALALPGGGAAADDAEPYRNPGKTWVVQAKRFGDYADAGGGDVGFGVVACASYMREPKGAHWAAMNPNAFGFGNELPCGAKLRVTNRATKRATVVTVVDRMGDATSGLDLDDQAFRAIDTDGAGERDGRMQVRVKMLPSPVKFVS